MFAQNKFKVTIDRTREKISTVVKSIQNLTKVLSSLKSIQNLTEVKEIEKFVDANMRYIVFPNFLQIV